MKRKIISRSLFEILLAIVLFLIVLICLMLDVNNFKIPQMFIIKIDNIEDFFNTVFSIQASVSTMSIAIIALLSDAKKENLYGVSVPKYIMQEKPLIFKHKRVVIAIIFLIFVDYIAVSLKFYNISTAIFFITIMLVGFMVFDVYEVFYGMDGIKLEIKQYLIKNCDENILGNLKKDLYNAIENSDSMRIGDNLELFYNIMNSILNDSKSVISKERLEDIYVEIFQSLFNFGNSSKNLLGLRYLLQLLKLANNNMPNAALAIWDKLEQRVYQAISTIRGDELLDTRIIKELHKNLYLNTNIKRNESEIYMQQNNYGLRYYSSHIYYYMFINKKSNSLDSDDDRIKRMMFQEIFDTIDYGKFKEEDYEIKNIVFQELAVYTKTLLDYYEKDILEKYFFKNLQYADKDDLRYDSYFVSVLIYMYYLSQREELVSDEARRFTLNLIELNKRAIDYYVSSNFINISKKTSIQYIYNILRPWEIMPDGKAKWIQMEGIIKDFYIYCLVELHWNENALYNDLKNIIDDNVFSYNSRYFEHNKDNTIKFYNEFVNLFFTSNINEYQAKSKIEMLHEVLTRIYRDVEIENSIKKELLNDDLNPYVEKAKVVLDRHLVELLSVCSNKRDEQDVKYYQHKTMTFSYDFYVELVEDIFSDTYLDMYFKDYVVDSLIEVIKNNIELQSVSFDDNEKLNKFFNVLNKNDIDVNTIIGNRDSFYGDPRDSEYQKFMNNKKRIKFPVGNNLLIGINSDLIYINEIKFGIAVEDYSYEEIKGMCKTDGRGNLLYNVTNSIYLPFDKEDIKSYINRIRKKLAISIDVSFYITDDIIGGGIVINDNQSK